MNILIVVEDSSYRLHLRKYMAEEGHNIILTSSVKDGLNTVKAKPVDLVICDLDMKYMDGVDFCRTVRKLSGERNVFFIFVSIYDDELTKAKLDVLDGCTFIRKGGSVGDIIALINKFSTEINTENQLHIMSSQTSTDTSTSIDIKPAGDVKTNSKDFFNSHILVVDDDDNFRRVLEDMLVDEGYKNITTAIDGGEAITHLQSRKFDLVLLDIIMPNVSGFGVLKYISENIHDTKVIMVTAYADLKLAVEAKALGASDFIAKPFMRNDLVNTIKSVLTGL